MHENIHKKNYMHSNMRLFFKILNVLEKSCENDSLFYKNCKNLKKNCIYNIKSCH